MSERPAVSGTGIIPRPGGKRKRGLALWHEAAVFSLWLAAPMNTLSSYTSHANVHTHIKTFMQTDSPGYLRGACSCSCAYSTSACNSTSVQSVGPPDDCGRRAGGGGGGSLRHAAHFPLCGFVASGTGRPRGARTRGRRANGMTMPALATRASTLLFLNCGHKFVCVAKRNLNSVFFPVRINVFNGDPSSHSFLRPMAALSGTIKLAVLPGV